MFRLFPCISKKSVVVKETVLPIYKTYQDSGRVLKIDRIMKVIEKYFIDYEEEEKNVLHYRMVETRNWISGKYKDNLHPIFLDNLRQWDEIENLENQFKLLSDDNLNGLYNLFKEYEDKRKKLNDVEEE